MKTNELLFQVKATDLLKDILICGSVQNSELKLNYINLLAEPNTSIVSLDIAYNSVRYNAIVYFDIDEDQFQINLFDPTDSDTELLFNSAIEFNEYLTRDL